MCTRLSSCWDVLRATCARGTCQLLLLALCAGAFSASADIQQPPGSRSPGGKQQQRRVLPANGVPVHEVIDQGGTVELTLQGRGQIGKFVEFQIRTQPVHGTLTGPPRRLSRNSAAVTYVHRAGDGAGTDSFTYCVQAKGSEVSAPVEVSIEIRDTPPSVVASPAELDFGAVKIGDTSGADLILENHGGGEAIGRLDPPPPWTVDGPAEYRLVHGQHQTFHLLFGPKSDRSFSESLPLLSDGGASPHLLGTGLGVPGEPAPVQTGASVTSAAVAAQARAKIAATEALVAAAAAATPAPAPAPAASATPLEPNVSLMAAPLQTLPQPGDLTPNGGAHSLAVDTSGYITLYDTGVKQIKLLATSRTTLSISWLPADPPPKSYRVELRYLTIDAGTNLRIDWRPYAQVDLKVGQASCTATVRGLPPGVLHTLRVVAVDAAGNLSAASATLQATTLPPSTFWRLTPLKILGTLLLVCLGLVVRKRWENQQILRELDQHRADNPIVLYHS